MMIDELLEIAGSRKSPAKVERAQFSVLWNYCFKNSDADKATRLESRRRRQTLNKTPRVFLECFKLRIEPRCLSDING